MNTAGVDQAQPLLQPQEGPVECQNMQQQEMGVETSSIGIRQVMHNFKQLKSFDIMNSALTIFTSNTKLMFLMIFSSIPFFVFLVFYELKLHKAILAAPAVLENLLRVTSISTVYLGNGTSSVTSVYPGNGSSYVYLGNGSSSIYPDNGSSYVIRTPIIDYDNNRMEFLFGVLQLCLLYLILYPLLELLSMTIVVQNAAKIYVGEKPSTLKDVFYKRNTLKGVLFTYGYVQLLSFMTVVGLIWIFWNHLIFTGSYWCQPYYYFQESDLLSYCLHKLSVGIHTLFFVALLYKYLDWSAFWNMSMVISVLEEESRLDAFGMTNYYGKHFKPTGFQLMLWFVGLNIVLRLPCLYVFGGSSKLTAFAATSVVMGLICLGNLVKWVAFVLYYFDCKQQTMEKKNDVEIGKTAKV